MSLTPHTLLVLLLATFGAFSQAQTAGTVIDATVIQVGPSRAVKTIAEAAQLAKDGFTVEVDAGEYVGDVATWTQDQLTLRAVGGRARLKANGSAAERKAIWVVRGGKVSVTGFDFSGTQVPDRNGAGIRLERGELQVRDCSFVDNENGILTGNDPTIQLDVVDSEFAHNGYGDGLSHNLYVGAIARLSVTGSHFHHALVGHLLKSRAAVNDIRYNRLADGPGGRASYELEFPNGGLVYAVGNILEQGETTQNPHVISYATEGYRWPVNALYLVHNTLVDKKPSGGVLLRVRPGAASITAVNNLLVARGDLTNAGPGDYRNNVVVADNVFEQGPLENYRLRPNARLVSRLAANPVGPDGAPLQPNAQYQPPRGVSTLKAKPHHPGAVQPVISTPRP